MSTASQNLGQRLAVLRERLLPPSGYETAFDCFLAEFVGDRSGGQRNLT
ncbi:MAG TPA: hypothetical protein VI454_09795 [Verrucomicrobiae bacterium]